MNNASSAAAHRVRITGVVVFGAFLALLNQTVMSPALPVIMADFAIDASTAQWIMSIYPLVSGIMVPVSAFLIDRFTTRQLFFAATGAFAAGTALCAAAPDIFPADLRTRAASSRIRRASAVGIGGSNARVSRGEARNRHGHGRHRDVSRSRDRARRGRGHHRRVRVARMPGLHRAVGPCFACLCRVLAR